MIAADGTPIAESTQMPIIDISMLEGRTDEMKAEIIKDWGSRTPSAASPAMHRSQ